MVTPDHFGYNPETAATNIFQHKPDYSSEEQIRKKALVEFNNAVKTLRSEGLNILILQKRDDVMTPDAIFPNNWFSHHEDNTLILYPMFASNRRLERQPDALISLLIKAGIPSPRVIDISSTENINQFLESTGSMVLDREHKVAFSIESTRTTEQTFRSWCRKFGFKGVLFHAESKHIPLYHTNIFMTIGREYAILCPQAISDSKERKMVIGELKQLDKELIFISMEQLGHYCSNCIQTQTVDKEQKIVMSKVAYGSFSQEQRDKLKRYGTIVSVSIPTIEWVGGGSIRCMMAEIFGIILDNQ